MNIHIDSDPHHNIFCYYSGNTGKISEKDEASIERQLENNTTKALINTLSNCSNTIQFQFFQWLKINGKGPYHYRLQETKMPKKSLRIVLGIVPHRTKKINVNKLPVSHKVTKAPCDALVFGRGWIILIESKVKGGLDEKQIARHFDRLGLNNNNKNALVQKTWKDIYDFFKKAKKRSLPPVDTFLIEQFCEYLELTSLAGFTGIKAQHFDYMQKKDRNDQNVAIIEMMDALTEDIKASMDKKLKHSYTYSHRGQINAKDNSCWVAFSKIEQHNNVAHISIELWPHRFEVFANVETGVAVKKLRKLLLMQDRERFDYIIKNLPTGYEVILRERVQSRIRKFEYIPVGEPLRVEKIRSGTQGEKELDRVVLSFLKKVRLPQFSIRREFPASEVINKGSDFKYDILRTMNVLNSFVEFVNNQ